jgi:hypothetical protein
MSSNNNQDGNKCIKHHESLHAFTETPSTPSLDTHTRYNAVTLYLHLTIPST